MPEGDSLVRLAHRLRPVMQDRVLLRSDFRVPQFATLDLAGWRVREVRSTGKYLSMVLNAPATNTSTHEQLVVLSHLGMDGSWQLDVRPTHKTRCILGLEQHQVVGSSLSVLQVVSLDQAQQRLSVLGPDLLAPGWEHPGTSQILRDQAVSNLLAAPDQPIATALLDQRLIAGLGNIYRCEVLLLSGLSPYRKLSELSAAQLSGLVMLSRNLMTLNVPPTTTPGAPRSTVDVRPAIDEPFGVRVATTTERARTRADRQRQHSRPSRHWVYGRQREGCLRCGGPVRIDALGPESETERTVYWCPHCQPA